MKLRPARHVGDPVQRGRRIGDQRASRQLDRILAGRRLDHQLAALVGLGIADALAAAEATVKPKQTSAAVLTFEAAVELIKLSAHEHDEAVKKGRIVEGCGWIRQAAHRDRGLAQCYTSEDAREGLQRRAR